MTYIRSLEHVTVGFFVGVDPFLKWFVVSVELLLAHEYFQLSLMFWILHPHLSCTQYKPLLFSSF